MYQKTVNSVEGFVSVESGSPLLIHQFLQSQPDTKVVNKLQITTTAQSLEAPAKQVTQVQVTKTMN